MQTIVFDTIYIEINKINVHTIQNHSVFSSITLFKKLQYLQTWFAKKNTSMSQNYGTICRNVFLRQQNLANDFRQI